MATNSDLRLSGRDMPLGKLDPAAPSAYLCWERAHFRAADEEITWE